MFLQPEVCTPLVNRCTQRHRPREWPSAIALNVRGSEHPPRLDVTSFSPTDPDRQKSQRCLSGMSPPFTSNTTASTEVCGRQTRRHRCICILQTLPPLTTSAGQRHKQSLPRRPSATPSYRQSPRQHIGLGRDPGSQDRRELLARGSRSLSIAATVQHRASTSTALGSG